MRYTVILTEEVRAQLRALPRAMCREIGHKLFLLEDNLRGDVQKLKGSRSEYRLRMAIIERFLNSKIALSRYMLLGIEKKFTDEYCCFKNQASVRLASRQTDPSCQSRAARTKSHTGRSGRSSRAGSGKKTQRWQSWYAPTASREGIKVLISPPPAAVHGLDLRNARGKAFYCGRQSAKALSCKTED